MRAAAISMWHACGTVKMGKVGEQGTCVDKDFKVIGMESLRVVNMSVAPFLPRWVLSPFCLIWSELYSPQTTLSAHLQAVAYLVEEIAAEKIIAQHSVYDHQ